MPPIVALIICTIFVFWLLRLEHKQSPDVSFALWIPTLWMLVNCSKPLAVWFNMGGADMESGSPLDRAFLLVFAFLGLAIIATRHCFWSNLIQDNIWVVILILYMLVSISWADMPFVCFKRWFREIVVIIMVFFVATESDPRQAFQSIFRRSIYVLLPFSLLLIKYYPDLGVTYCNAGNQMWMGVTLHKNMLSGLCTLSIFFLIWTFIMRRLGSDKIVVWYQKYIEVFLLFLSSYIFMGPEHTPTNSATSLITLVSSLTALIGLLWMQKHGKTISANSLTLIIGLIIIYGTITPFIGELKIIDISSVVGRDESLTGRADIWAALVPYVRDKPVFGYGFGGFWTDAMRARIMAAHSHNGYLEIILNTGLIGLVLFSMFLVKNCRNAQKEMTRNFDLGALWSCFLLIIVLQNITEPTAISLQSHNAVILLFLSYTAAADTAKRKKYCEKIRSC